MTTDPFLIVLLAAILIFIFTVIWRFIWAEYPEEEEHADIEFLDEPVEDSPTEDYSALLQSHLELEGKVRSLKQDLLIARDLAKPNAKRRFNETRQQKLINMYLKIHKFVEDEKLREW